MIITLRKLYFLLSPKERLSSLLLLMQMVGSSLVSTFVIALIFPFMSLALDPTNIQRPGISLLYRLTHFNNVHHFLIFLGIFLFITLVLGNILTAITMWTITSFAFFRNFSFSKRLFKNYLSRPYAFYLDKNSSTLTKNVMVEIYTIIQSVLLGGIRALDQLISILMILFLLLIINPLLSLFVLLGMGGVYVGIFVVVRKRLSAISEGTVTTRNLMFKIVSEAFGGIKDVKFFGIEENVENKYSQVAQIFARYLTTANVIGQIPRYALEIAAFGGIILVLLYFLMFNYNVSKIIPLLSLYAFAGYRLLPSLQNVFFCITQVKANLGSLDVVYEDMIYMPVVINKKKEKGIVLFDKELCIKNAIFSYPGTNKPAISNLSMSIRANTTVGLVGHTGAGKTTVVDIILGLLILKQGNITVDGVEINEENIRSWQNSLGYVPQHIYLSDASIASNIAFGLPEEEINIELVRQAAHIASLGDFIEKELMYGYQTIVGERGIRLSGGQIQRIGIARALYRDPQVLVFDEATSALDGVTEDIILQSIRNIAHKKTVIIIAHRFTTIRECDTIFFMKNGEIFDFGGYNELLERNLDFRKMAKYK